MAKSLTPTSPQLDRAKRNELSLDPVMCLSIIDSLMNNEAVTALELSEKLKLPIKTVMAVMSHPDFTKRFHRIKKAVAKTEFDTVAYDRLIKIIRKTSADEDLDYVDENGRIKHEKSAADKNAIAAAKALADILGMTEKKGGGSTVNVNLSFDAIIRDAQARGTDDDVIFPGFED